MPALAESRSATVPAPRQQPPIFRLVVAGTDRPGIVAAISTFLADAEASIVSSNQYTTDPDGGRLFMRMEFSMALSEDERPAFEVAFAAEVAERFELEWRIWPAGRPKRVALLASRYDHCLLDLLWRWRRGELEAEVGLVASNHPDLGEDVASFGIPYHHVPVAKDAKEEAEERLLELLAGKFDLVVLARYMQILSGEFLRRVGCPIINIHHSFLPAFAGAGPYQRAKERGVKLVGATSHYVTEELDAGPIIEQDVIRVRHGDSTTELERLGADIERAVLARAVKWHCEDRVIVDDRTTVVF